MVEHCVGPLGVGTLILKPMRHCIHIGDLEPDEAAELGPLLRTVAACVQELNAAEQVYSCLWSHANWNAEHIHFVIQPSWSRLQEVSALPGPMLQVAMFARGEAPAESEVQAFADRARAWSGWPGA